MKLGKINQAIIDEMDNLGMFGPARDCFGEVAKSRGGLRRYRNSNQIFAVDGDTAHDVTPFGIYVNDKWDENFCATLYYRPIVVGGSVFESLPDEGRTGILTEVRMCSPKRGRYTRWLGWIPLGWLHTRELDLDPEQIEQNIMDDIDAGQTCITGAYDRG
jgi:hypothetical protein